MVRTEAVTGLVLAEGRPASGSDVLLVSKDLSTLLAATSTTPDGRFTLHPEGDADQAILAAKLHGPSVGFAHHLITLPARRDVVVDFDSTVTFHRLDGEIDASAGLPGQLNVFIDPVRLDGVPDGLDQYFLVKRPTVIDAHFGRLEVHGSRFAMKLQTGTYRIGGEYLNYDRPEMLNPQEPNFIVNAATTVPGNAPLPGDELLGFTLRVDQDCRVVLWLRVVADRELTG